MKLIVSILFAFSLFTSDRSYVKRYYDDGKIKEEGWMTNNNKTGYWYSYYENGEIKEEGSFENSIRGKYWKFYTSDGIKQMEGRFKHGLANEWWVFYKNNSIWYKAEYNRGKKNGYALYYINGNIGKVEKYMDDIKTGQWTDLKSFKLDNN